MHTMTGFHFEASNILVTEMGEVVYHPPYKRSPKIVRVNGAWVCHKGTRYGWSYASPVQAYQFWLRKELAL